MLTRYGKALPLGLGRRHTRPALSIHRSFHPNVLPRELAASERKRPKLPSWKLSQSSEVSSDCLTRHLSNIEVFRQLGSLCSAVTWHDPEDW